MNVFLSTSGYSSRGTLSKICSTIEMVNPTGATDSRGYRHKLRTLGKKSNSDIHISLKKIAVVLSFPQNSAESYSHFFSTRDLWVGQMITVIYRRGTMGGDNTKGPFN